MTDAERELVERCVNGDDLFFHSRTVMGLAVKVAQERLSPERVQLYKRAIRNYVAAGRAMDAMRKELPWAAVEGAGGLAAKLFAEVEAELDREKAVE